MKMNRTSLLSIVLFSVCISSGYSTIVTYSDGSVKADFEVECTDTEMTVYFNLTQIEARTTSTVIRPYVISFFGQTAEECTGFSETATPENVADDFRSGKTKFERSIWLNASLPDGCGVNQLSDSEYFMYNQTVVISYGADSSNSLVTRTEYDVYNVMCLRKRQIITYLDAASGSGSGSGSGYYEVSVRKTGHAYQNETSPFNLQLTHEDSNGVTQNTYKLGEYIHVKLEFKTSLPLKNVAKKCWATSDGTSNEYELVGAGGCITDNAATLLYNQKKYYEFKVEAFRFLGLDTSSVYIACESVVCLTANFQGDCGFCNPFGRKRRSIENTTSQKETVRASTRTTAFYIVTEKDEHRENSLGQNIQTNNQQQFMMESIIIILLLVIVIFIAVSALKKWNVPREVQIHRGVEYKVLEA